MDLSLILPCYNEGPYLTGNLHAIYMLLTTINLSFEIIIIEDKSTNDTLQRVREFAHERPHVQMFAHDINRGRGYTVSEGIKKATGKVVGFIDVDLEVDCHNILPFVFKVMEGYDVVSGFRIYKHRWWDFRWIQSKGYFHIAKVLCHWHTPFHDTEAGFKFFNRKKILPVIEEVEDPHWFWDTEVMVRSYYQGLKMAEVPILFIRKNQSFSTLNSFSDTFYYLNKLLKFRKVIRQYKKNGLPLRQSS
ncbi:MAG: glycosyltransferase [Deltaproteobacteria bacterium]|nr:glycosyltransferase [Deltaproteobacteria bacterium]